MDTFRIEVAETPEQVEAVKTLFREYAETPDVSVCVSGFTGEIAGLPGEYGRLDGLLLIAIAGDGPAGCVALRRLADDVCEIKRLYVRPVYRGEGLGRLLVEEVIGHAFSMGYNRICLDTLPSMKGAQKLYRSFGFVPIEPYLAEPTPGALCFELRLNV